MDIFFGDGGGPYVPSFDPEWMFGDSDFVDDSYPEDRDVDMIEREALDDALRDNDSELDRIQKVPLSSRHTDKKKGSPFMRWACKVATGQKKCTDPLEYTDEERDAMLQAELKDDIERF